MLLFLLFLFLIAFRIEFGQWLSSGELLSCAEISTAGQVRDAGLARSGAGDAAELTSL
jgi:hypothetical protein